MYYVLFSINRAYYVQDNPRCVDMRWTSCVSVLDLECAVSS